MKNLLLFMFLMQSFLVNATVHEIGSSKTYISPNALYAANIISAGDTILIDAETYVGNAALAVWGADDLLIKGVGGKPHLEVNGEYIWGKGIWVLGGNNITVENIEFSGAAVPDKNGAGIRLDGVGLTVRHCYFHDNENGILTGNQYEGDILIEYTEFNHNGHGDGYSHNLYIGHVNKLTFQFNYSHHATIGHNLKSRANENYILYNRIMDEDSGNSSRLIDLPNGGFSIVMGNVLMQGTSAENNNLIGYGQEGLSNTEKEVHIINNTFVNKRAASCIFVDIKAGTVVANISNNIFTGTGIVLNGTATTMNNNYVNEIIADVNLADELSYDYTILDSSPAVDYGVAVAAVNGYTLTPEFSYVHPQSKIERETSNGIIDAGAYEYFYPVNTFDVAQEKLRLFPNPTSGELRIDHDIEEVKSIKIYNAIGRLILVEKNMESVDVGSLSTGLYQVVIHADGKRYVGSIQVSH